MKTVTAHQARTHLSRLPREVPAGDTVVILGGSVPMTRPVAVPTQLIDAPDTRLLPSEVSALAIR